MGQDKIGGAPAELKKCPNCGEEVEPTWSKCPSCSKDLKAPSSPAKGVPPPPTLTGAKKCPACGGEVEAGWMKCPECGKDLK
jgi:uncharacterized protein (UPF0212 family)